MAISAGSISELPISGDSTTSTPADGLTVTGSATALDSFAATIDTRAIINVIAEEVLLASPAIITFNDVATESLIATINTATFDALDVEVLLIDLQSVSDNTPSAADLWTAIVRAPAPPVPGPVPIRSTPLVAKLDPYQPVPTNMQDWYPWLQLVSRAVNGILAGGQNTTLASFTLNANATSTTLTDSRIGNTSFIHLVPLTENAANESIWISDQKQGSAVINHANNAETDRTYRVLIVA